MIVGDFNIHIDDRNSPLTKTFLQLLDEYFMTLHINTPTHKNDHILDLFIAKNHADISPEINVIDPRVRVSSRDIKDIPVVQFTSDVASDLAQLARIIDGDEVNRNVHQYFEVCCKAHDKYAPIITFVPLRKQGKRSRKKHLSKEAIRKIALKQMLWKVYKHTGNVEDYTNYKEALNLATTEIRKSKRTFKKNWQVI